MKLDLAQENKCEDQKVKANLSSPYYIHSSFLQENHLQLQD